MRRIFIGIVCVLIACAPCMAFAATASPTDEAQRLYQSVSDAIYQVQDIDIASGKKTSIGSGFQFDASGLIATNYHVISGALNHPKNDRLEYLRDRGEKGALKIVAVDVVNDLAILQMDIPGKKIVELGASHLPKGTRLFSLGNPHDIGFTIIEGTYNGLSKEGLSDRIHFSGALNPGMSGGPALSHDGRVVGVNVATAGNQISFLIPVEPLKILAKELRESGKKFANFTAHATSRIGAQLLEAQRRNVEKLLSKTWESVPFGPMMVPGRIDPSLKCWGSTLHEEKDPFLYNRSLCETQERLFLDDGFETGFYRYRYDYLVAKEGMDILRFYNFYEQQYSIPARDDEGNEENVTNYVCTTRFVDLASRRWKTSFCARQYKKYPHIFDIELVMAMVGAEREGMIISLDADGVSQKSALALEKRFMEEIKEKKEEKHAKAGKG